MLQNNWEVLKSLPVDIPLPGIHTYHFDMLGKLEQIRSGQNKMSWLDPQGYRGIIAHFEQEFKIKLAKQLKEGPPPPLDPNRVPGPPSP